MKVITYNMGSSRPKVRPPHWSIGSLCLLAMVVSGCFREKHPPASRERVEEEAFRAIGRKPFHHLNTGHAVVLEGDTLYLIRFNAGLKIPQDQALILDLEKESDSDQTRIVNDRMKWEVFKAGDTIPYAFLKVPLPERKFKRFQIELPTLDWQGTYDTISISANRDHLESRGVQRCEGPVSRRYLKLNQWVFRQQLAHGIFFEVQRQIYLLFYERTCWVIRRKPVNGSKKFMLHFIDQDSRFDNYSFPIRPSAFEGCMEDAGRLWINRLHLERPFDSYRKIRVGEFTGEGNIWTMTLQVSHLLENELLRYVDELE